MENFPDFELKAGWDKEDDWDVTYLGTNSNVIIPAELFAQAETPVSIAFDSEHEGITDITFPGNITSVWFGTFYYDKNLNAIHVADDSPFLKTVDGVLFSKDGKTLIKVPPKMSGEYIVPQGVEEIYNFAFRRSELEKILLPDTATKIQHGAFEDCRNLKSLSIPAGVKKIEFCLFAGCTQLMEFRFAGDTEIEYTTIPAEKDIEEKLAGESLYTYSDAYLLACLERYPQLNEHLYRFLAAAKRGKREKNVSFLNEVKKAIPPIQESYILNILNETEAEIKKYVGQEETLEIPAEIEGKKIVSIGRSAFQDCVSLEKVILPETCQTIGRSAFSGCKSLKEINLPHGLTVLAEKVFCDCVSLEKLSLPAGLLHIEAAALKHCENLDGVVLPDGLLSLGKESLYGCKFNYGPKQETTWGYTLAEFTIPASVIKMGSDIFGKYPKAKEQFGVFEYKVKLLVTKGSVAHKYAMKHRIRFAF